MKYYTGIGSRETPAEILELMSKISADLSLLDYVCRSGGAIGADSAFEKNAIKREIFLPWDNFNGRTEDGMYYIVPEYSEEYVRKYHPRSEALSRRGLQLMSRNTYQVLGKDLKTPSDFLLCWTKDGKDSGGTGQAIRIAKNNGIPIFNLKHQTEDFFAFLRFTSFLK